MIKCPQCEKLLRVDEKMKGTLYECRHCKAAFKITTEHIVKSDDPLSESTANSISPAFPKQTRSAEKTAAQAATKSNSSRNFDDTIPHGYYRCRACSKIISSDSEDCPYCSNSGQHDRSWVLLIVAILLAASTMLSSASPVLFALVQAVIFLMAFLLYYFVFRKRSKPARKEQKIQD